MGNVFCYFSRNNNSNYKILKYFFYIVVHGKCYFWTLILPNDSTQSMTESVIQPQNMMQSIRYSLNLYFSRQHMLLEFVVAWQTVMEQDLSCYVI